MPGNKLLTYQGKTRDMGTCKTAFGARGTCLTPYISIAADLSVYRLGDIIEMPAMKGKKIRLPDGGSFLHPGYFIVEDSGGAIRGKNRFDFFTGAHGMRNSKNAFGTQGDPDMQMVTSGDCNANKTFSVIRQGTPNYEQSLASIDNTRDYAASQQRYVIASPLGDR